jgi:hypothetical protein
MDAEFPKTLNSALSIAGKVHGSITDLVKILGDLQADLAGLEPAMNQALAIMKDAPTAPPVPVAAAAPVVTPKPVVVEPKVELKKSEFVPHTSTPEK